MDEIRNKAKELLESNAVQVVIGFGQGTGNNTKAIFVRKPEDTSKLIYNEKCVQNLALYLLKHEVKHFGKIAIIANVPILRSILQLASEFQVNDGEIVVLGISPELKLVEFSDFKAIEDYLVTQDFDIRADEKDMINKINSMSMNERWAFWNNEFSKCIKCYACRQTCPLCYCTRCFVESNQPQWISVAAHQLGNMEWHILRAMHLAGRCINCGECARACPVEIPLNLLTYCLNDDIKSEFNSVAGTSAKLESVLSSYKAGDKENFIG
jgi:formate dehydrogenase (coenzyme F420) beta subunit